MKKELILGYAAELLKEYKNELNDVSSFATGSEEKRLNVWGKITGVTELMKKIDPTFNMVTYLK